MNKLFYNNKKENINVHSNLISLEKEVSKAILKLSFALKKNSKVFFCGNGGSAADAQHLSAELLVKFKKKRRPLPGISLALDSSTMTACSNDFKFEDIFLRNFRALARKGDILVAISTSGKSKNIINVLKYAKKRNFLTIGFLGNGGGLAKKYCNISLIVPSKSVSRIQECHIFLGHFIIDQIEKKF